MLPRIVLFNLSVNARPHIEIYNIDDLYYLTHCVVYFHSYWLPGFKQTEEIPKQINPTELKSIPIHEEQGQNVFLM